MIRDSVCLVTGGAGTIGSTIVDQLVGAGAAELLKAYAAISDMQMRRDVLAMVKSAARISRAGVVEGAASEVA